MGIQKISSYIGNVPVSGKPASVVKDYVKRERDIEKSIVSKFPESLRFIRKLKCLISESGTTIINAVGTGLVAPVFIAFNPLSKTDEDTKKYTAMRQPISALLAVATQVGLSVPLDGIMARMSNDGWYSHAPLLDQTLIQDESYLTRQLKKTYKKETAQQLQARVDRVRNEQYAKAIDSVKRNNAFLLNGKPLPEHDLKLLMSKTLIEIRDEMRGRISSMQEKDIAFKVDRAKFIYSNSKKILALMEPIQKACKEGRSYEEVMKIIDASINTLKTGNANPEFINILNEFKTRDSVELLANRAASYTKRIAQIRKANSLSGVKTLIINGYDAPTRKLLTESTIVEEMVKGLEKNKDFTGMIKKLNALETTDGTYKLVRTWANLVKDRLKKTQSRTGLIANLLLLPITCSLLNWVYPRFMDIFFPELSAKKSKKIQGGAK